jgi:predicted nucleotidyltransferase
MSDWNVTEEKVAVAVDRIVRVLDPVRIVAFGSRAQGSATPDSDLDLAVILEGDPASSPQLRYSTSFLDLHLPIDVLVTGIEHHLRLRNSINSIHYDIDHKGIVLYEKTYGSPDRSAIGKVSG